MIIEFINLHLKSNIFIFKKQTINHSFYELQKSNFTKSPSKFFSSQLRIIIQNFHLLLKTHSLSQAICEEFNLNFLNLLNF